jgi:hypothetical protein
MTSELMDLMWTAGSLISALALCYGGYLAIDSEFDVAATLRRILARLLPDPSSGVRRARRDATAATPEHTDQVVPKH